MRIKETIERDCCQDDDLIVIGQLCKGKYGKLYQCKYCKKKYEMIKYIDGSGNWDYKLARKIK